MWIDFAVSMLLHLGMTATRTTRTPETRDIRKESACDAVANHLQLSYEAVVTVWQNLRDDDGWLPLPWEAWERSVTAPEECS